MNKNTLWAIAAGFVGSSALYMPTSAFGQQVLEEIVVTSQRREESLQSAPVAVTAFSPDRIDSLGISDPADLAMFVPNASFGDGTGRGSNGASFAIRGVSEARVSPVLDPAVAVYIDDVYYGRPQTTFLKLLDVQRVEVLRGPQGTLFGKNAAGGAVRYITVKPDLAGNSGYLDIQVGDYSRINVKGAMNVVLSDDLAMRVSAASLSRDGYITRLADNQSLGIEDTSSYKIQFRYQPSADTTVDFGFDYTTDYDHNGPTKLIDYWGFNGAPDAGPGGSAPNANVTRAWNFHWAGTPIEYAPNITPDFYTVGGDGRLGRTDTTSTGLSLDITHVINDGISLRSITGYREVKIYEERDPDDQASAYTFFDDITTINNDFWSQEFQLSGLAFNDRLDWVAGVYYSIEKPSQDNLEGRDARRTSQYGAQITNDLSAQETKSSGIFAQGTYAFDEQWALTLGIRYTEDDKNFRLDQFASWDFDLDALSDAFGLPNLLPGVYGTCDTGTGAVCLTDSAEGGDVFTSVTPRIALEYQANDDIMLYSAVSKGFKAGGTNDTIDDVDTPFDAETVWSYELGARTEIFDGRARLNATYFQMDYTDKATTVTTSTVCNRRCTTNVGDGEISGWEFEATALLTDNLQLNAGVGLLDAQWDEIRNPTAGVTLNSEWSRAPEMTGNIGLRWNGSLNNGTGIVATVDYAYTDEQEASPQDTTTITLPSYELVNARLKFVSAGGEHEFSVFCTNCMDETYLTGGASWAATLDNALPGFDFKPLSHPAWTANGGTFNPYSPAIPGIAFVNVGAPRMLGLGYRYNF